MNQSGSQVQILIYADGKAGMKGVNASELELLPEAPPQAGPKSKNLNWLDGQAGQLIIHSLPLGADFDLPVCGTMLSNSQVETGLQEMLWRLLPGKVLVLSSHWLGLAVQELTCTSEHLRNPDLSAVIKQQVELASKGELLLCPLLVQEPCRH